jgi:TonB-linked SusC/RagA family outer membrane protein
MIMKRLYSSMKAASVACALLFSSLGALAQETSVSGTVRDEAGNGMPGVNVVVKGTTTGTATDGSGGYRLSVSGPNAVLVFTFIGYATQEVTVGNRTAVDVTMSPDVQTLQELVVTGYTTQQKKDISGSVAIVDTRDMKKIASSNFADQLQGKVAGVQIATSGDPGSAQFVRIRGIGTINNNEPLYVIDGVPVQNEANMNFLNPSDIETMQVLKDAAAASVYGARAANGVVVITTKKGRGKTKLNVDFWTGIQTPGKEPELANPDELLQINQGLAAGAGIPFASNFYINQGGTWILPDYAVRGGGFIGGALEGDPAADPSKYYLNPDPNGDASLNYQISRTNKSGTDWFKETFNSAPVTNFQISASGGSDKGNFFISGNYMDWQGIMIHNEYTRYQTRMNASFNITDNIRIGENINIAYQTQVGSMGNPNEGSALSNAYRMPQIIPVYDINGYFAGPAAVPSNAGNPVAQQFRSEAGSSAHSFRTTGDIYGEVDFLKNFTFTTKFGLDYGSGPGTYYSYRNYEATEVNASNSLYQSYYNNRNWVFYNVVNYAKEFGDHNLNVLVGTEARSAFYEGFNASGAKLAFGDDPFYRTLGNTQGGTYSIGSYKGENKMQSYFLNVNYSLMDKYLFSGVLRRDGSSKFINNRWGTFPAASFGWRLSKETFMADISAINDMKFRVSYGATGNNETGTGDYPGFSNFGTDIATSSYDINGTGNTVVSGFNQTSTGNPDLKWETTYLFNVGVDATVFDKFDATVEYFNRTTKDMIYAVELPLENGSVGRLNQNIGEMVNKGMEFSLTYRGTAGTDLSYNIGFTGTTYKNEVVKLEANENTFIRSGGSRIGDITYTTAGEPISNFYGFIADGIWTEDPAGVLTTPGDAKQGRMRFRDLNGDGAITSEDETFIGSPIPSFIMGLNLTANFKNFDFTAYLNGVYGVEIFNFMKYFTHFPAFQANYSKEMLYNAGTTNPVLDRNDNYSAQRSSFYVEDGSYTRLRNLQIGYTLPAATVSRIGLSRLRVYFQAQNLLTFSNYSGLDPDVTISNITEGYASGRDQSLGVDYGRYPWTKSFIFGVNIEL